MQLVHSVAEVEGLIMYGKGNRYKSMCGRLSKGVALSDQLERPIGKTEPLLHGLHLIGSEPHDSDVEFR